MNVVYGVDDDVFIFLFFYYWSTRITLNDGCDAMMTMGTSQRPLIMMILMRHGCSW
jgi:hypothetical protein